MAHMKKTLRRLLTQRTTSADKNMNLQDFHKKYTMTDVLLGEGSFAKVKMGMLKKNNQNIAIKIVEKGGQKEGEIEGIRKEVNILKALNHKNIVKLYDWYETEDHVYIVMEYVGGGMLYDKIVGSSEIFSEEDVRYIMRTMVEALKHCKERGITHRDLKPQNILYTTKKEGSILKIVDFNLSSQLTPEALKTLQMQTRCGTPHYVAPEIVAGRKYGPSCDLWSLGCIIFVVASGGYMPFSSNGSDESEVENVLDQVAMGQWAFEPEHAWANVSQGLKDIITGLLQRNPKKRWTYEDILKHPWMKVGNLKEHTINMDPLAKRLKKKMKDTAVTFSAVGVFADLMGNPEQTPKHKGPLKQGNLSFLNDF